MMKKIFLLFIFVIFTLCGVGCAHEKYGEFSIDVVNTVSGVSAGMSKDGKLLVMSKDDQRQAVFISGSRTEQVQLFNCSKAPKIFAKVQFFGRKGISILCIDLPDRKMDLKFYRHREVGNDLTVNGKKAWILDLREVSPNGRELRIVYEVQGERERKTGTYNLSTNSIMVR